MRHWPLVIVLAFISLFVVVGKPSTSANINQSHAAQAATDAWPAPQSREVTVPEPSFQDAMFNFFETHPDPGVREEIPILIRAFQLRPYWKFKGVAASFVRYPDPAQGGKFVSMLAMDPDLIRGKKNRVRAQLVVYHEFQHYLQWRDGTIPEETFLYVPWTAVDLPRICKQKWYAEREAYQKECEFGRVHGLVDKLDQREALTYICRASGEDFDATLTRMLKLGDPSREACAHHWDAI